MNILFTFALAALPSLNAGGDWIELFDGSSLDGWTTTGGRYDGKAEWTVEGGAIVGREGAGGSGGLIYTEKEYENFEIEFDAWVVPALVMVLSTGLRREDDRRQVQ